VLLRAPEPLLGLLRRCTGIDELTAFGEPPPACDFWTPLLSVPGLLRTDLASIPSACDYLSADPARVARWAAELRPVRGLRVALCWQGNPKHLWDAERSFPLALLAPLARVPDVRLISLQTVHGAEQLHGLADGGAVLRLPELESSADAFSDLAALLCNVDLVITCDTALAHLAAALQVRTWIALPSAPDWRWLLGREDSPWYPTLRLFRQTRFADWPGVFERIAAALIDHSARSDLSCARQRSATSLR
jgi:hypothetical protein